MAESSNSFKVMSVDPQNKEKYVQDAGILFKSMIG